MLYVLYRTCYCWGVGCTVLYITVEESNVLYCTCYCWGVGCTVLYMLLLRCRMYSNVSDTMHTVCSVVFLVKLEWVEALGTLSQVLRTWQEFHFLYQRLISHAPNCWDKRSTVLSSVRLIMKFELREFGSLDSTMFYVACGWMGMYVRMYTL